MRMSYFALVLGVLVVSTNMETRADDFYWDNGGTVGSYSPPAQPGTEGTEDSRWGTAANWNIDMVPGSGLDDGVFINFHRYFVDPGKDLLNFAVDKVPVILDPGESVEVLVRRFHVGNNQSNNLPMFSLPSVRSEGTLCHKSGKMLFDPKPASEDFNIGGWGFASPGDCRNCTGTLRLEESASCVTLNSVWVGTADATGNLEVRGDAVFVSLEGSGHLALGTLGGEANIVVDGNGLLKFGIGELVNGVMRIKGGIILSPNFRVGFEKLAAEESTTSSTLLQTGGEYQGIITIEGSEDHTAEYLQTGGRMAGRLIVRGQGLYELDGGTLLIAVNPTQATEAEYAAATEGGELIIASGKLQLDVTDILAAVEANPFVEGLLIKDGSFPNDAFSSIEIVTSETIQKKKAIKKTFSRK